MSAASAGFRRSSSDGSPGIAIYLPADPSIPAPEVAAVDRQASFVNERHILLREQTGSFDVFAAGIEAVVGFIAALWIVSFAVAATRVRRRPPTTTPPRQRTAQRWTSVAI